MKRLYGLSISATEGSGRGLQAAARFAFGLSVSAQRALRSCANIYRGFEEGTPLPAEVCRRPFRRTRNHPVGVEIHQEIACVRGPPSSSGVGLTTLPSVFAASCSACSGRFAPLLSEVQIHLPELPDCEAASGETLAFSHLFPAHFNPFAHSLM